MTSHDQPSGNKSHAVFVRTLAVCLMIVILVTVTSVVVWRVFSKPSARTASHPVERREDLLVAVKAQQIGLQQLGRPTELNELLVNRVARMVFAGELGKKDLKQRTRKISKQSNGRQGGGATRPQDPREDPRDHFDRLYRELERA
jgi:hypothetical protein